MATYSFQCFKPRNRKEICAVYRLSDAGHPIDTIAYGVPRATAKRLAAHKTALGRSRRKRSRRARRSR